MRNIVIMNKNFRKFLVDCIYPSGMAASDSLFSTPVSETDFHMGGLFLFNSDDIFLVGLDHFS
jgi:hypothetical protein